MISQQLQNVVKQFERLKVDSLKQTLQAFDKEIPNSPKKPELLSMIKTLVSGQTYAFLLDDMEFKQIFADNLKLQNDQVTKELEVHGLTTTLDRLSTDALQFIITKLKLGEDVEADNKAEKISRIEEESFLQGVNKMFFKLNKDVLKSYCADLKVTHSGEVAKDTEELMKAMFDLEGDEDGENANGKEEEEEEEEEKEKPATTKTSKKPAAKNSKKPAAVKKPAEAVKKQARSVATTSKRAAAAPAKPTASSAKPAQADGGKRIKKPVSKLETEVAAATANGKKKQAAAPKRKKVDESDNESESEDDTPTNGKPTKENPNEFGGYYKGRVYVSPPASKIQKGITKDQLRDCFNIEPLVDFCRLNKITGVSGFNKQKLIGKIVKFLNGEEVNKKPKKPKATKKATKKSKTSSTTSTTTASS